MMVKRKLSKSKIEIKAKDFIDYSIENPNGYTSLTAAHAMGFSSLVGLEVRDKEGKFFGVIVGQDKDRSKGTLYGVIVDKESDKQRKRRILRRTLKELGVNPTEKTVDVIMSAHPVFAEGSIIFDIKDIKRR